MNNKERYCNIECKATTPPDDLRSAELPSALVPSCKTLEDIRDTCRRHIKNTQLMLLGCIDAEDLTDTDAFYLDMQERMWNDLLQDVNKMLEEKNAT